MTSPAGAVHRSLRVARTVHRYRWVVLVGWLVAMAVAGIEGSRLPDRLSDTGWQVPGSSSEQAAAALRTSFTARDASNALLVVRDDRYPAGTPAFDTRVGRAMRDVAGDPRLLVSGRYGWLAEPPPGQASFVSGDRRTAVTVLGMHLDDGTARRVLPAVQADLDRRYTSQGVRVYLVSSAAYWGELSQLSDRGLHRAELITLPLILLILLILYRGVVAAMASLVVGTGAVVLASGALGAVAERNHLSIFVQSATTMIGLGVGVDYALFIISRYRQELARSRDRVAALATTLRTSGMTVLSSGLIVMLAVSSLFLVNLGLIHSIALGIVVAVAFAVTASLVALPALLCVLGERLAPRGPRNGQDRRLWLLWRAGRPDGGRSAGRWAALTGRIMARPVTFLLVPVIALLALTVPVLRLNTFTAGIQMVHESSPVRTGFDLVSREFGPGAASPVFVVLRSEVGALDDPAGLDRLRDLRDRLTGLPHVVRVDSLLDALPSAGSATTSPDAPSPSPALSGTARRTVEHYLSADHRAAVLEILPDAPATAGTTRALVGAIHQVARQATGGGVQVAVGGETAEGLDVNSAIQRRLPVVLLLMLGVTYLVLLARFRSLLLPVKAILMNLLSAGASLGVLVLVFQHASGGAGDQPPGYVLSFVPILLLAVLFSLSTDYEVFLLDRVREEHRAGAGAVDSVARGLARTAPLISGAALLMVAVFGGFALAGILPIQQLGLGLAVAITLDATVIRLVVVPASMRLLGDWNWWLPGRRRLREREHPDPARDTSMEAAAVESRS